MSTDYPGKDWTRDLMHQKLTDTVAWLDREIESLTDCSSDYFRAAQIERLTDLRDDLVETLDKIKEGI